MKKAIKLPKKAFSGKVRQQRLSKVTYKIFDITKREQEFLFLVIVLLCLCGLATPYPKVAMWFGFALASYSAIANDSIQTIGTFIASNAHRQWWHLWLFMGLIFVSTVTYSWVIYHGDVSFQKLTAKGFAEAPQNFDFLQLCAPVALLILTRMRIPVSTTFLLLNVFATDAYAMFNVFQKSLYGYLIAFFTAILVWYLTARFADRYFQGKPGLGWVVLQWITSGLLWSVWLMQDASNIAVFLPRSLDALSFLIFIGFIFAGLGILFYLRGDRMQQLVNEKAGIKDIRAATLIDFIYMATLFYFKKLSNIPMSTTWVFIGLLGGRELAISLTKRQPKKRRKALQKSIKFIRKDLQHALIGLIISVILAILVNPIIRTAMQALLLNLIQKTKA
ncbi:MAG: hypothetical protein ACX93T_02120 [Bacteroidota bacterium]